MSDLMKNTGPKVLSVTELVFQIRDTLEGRFMDVFVEGEIGSLSRPSSGHVYFNLKDDKSQLRAVMFKMQNRLLRFTPEEGLVVVVRGRVSVYPARGSMQMIVDYMEPKGAGALAAAFEQLKKNLAEKGYFDRERKRPIPKIPFTIGIVTSPSGAALYDALKTVFLRTPFLHIILSPTKVQGDGAALEIAQAIARLCEDGRSQVILLVRGGGSVEDLWAFNEIPVADAIVNSPIPIVTGVGHEVDFTIADFCADMRAATPTAAAEAVAVPLSDLLQDLDGFKQRLFYALDFLIKKHRGQLDVFSHRMKISAVSTRFARQKLQGLKIDLVRAMKQVLSTNRNGLLRKREALFRTGPAKTASSRKEWRVLQTRLKSLTPDRLKKIQHQRLLRLRERLEAGTLSVLAGNRIAMQKKSALLHALSPLAVLRRGYSITRSADGKKVIRNVDQVSTEQSLEVLLDKGRLMVKVKEKSRPE